MNKLISFLLLIVLLPAIIFISVGIIITSGFPVIHWSKRNGQNNNLFLMPKFRTMKINTPQKATHLVNKGENYTTKFGTLLRKTSLDELPQLYCVLNGKMNFIGPRPALFNQSDLIELRTLNRIHFQKPGITGLAQVKGRDNLSIEEKVEEEKIYLNNKSIKLNVLIIFLTVLKVLKRENVIH